MKHSIHSTHSTPQTAPIERSRVGAGVRLLLASIFSSAMALSTLSLAGESGRGLPLPPWSPLPAQGSGGKGGISSSPAPSAPSAKSDPKGWMAACIAQDTASDASVDPQHARVVYWNCASLWDAITGKDAFPYPYSEVQRPVSARTPPINLRPSPPKGTSAAPRPWRPWNFWKRVRSWKTCDIYSPPTRAHRSEYIPCPPKGNPAPLLIATPPTPPPSPPTRTPTSLLPPPPRYSGPDFKSAKSSSREFRQDKGRMPFQQALVRAEPLPLLPQVPSEPQGGDLSEQGPRGEPTTQGLAEYMGNGVTRETRPTLGENSTPHYFPDGYRFGVLDAEGISIRSPNLATLRNKLARDVDETQPVGCRSYFPSIRRIVFAAPGAALPQPGRVNGFQYRGDSLYIRDDDTSIFNAAISAEVACDRSVDSGAAEGLGRHRTPGGMPRLPGTPSPSSLDSGVNAGLNSGASSGAVSAAPAGAGGGGASPENLEWFKSLGIPADLY